MQKEQDVKAAYFTSLVFGIAIICANVYFYCFRLFYDMGLGNVYAARILSALAPVMFHTPYYSKGLAILLGFLPFLIKTGKSTDASWASLLTGFALSLIMYLCPLINAPLYALFTLVGYFGAIIAFAHIMKKVYSSLQPPIDDEEETFEQCEKKITNEYSVNIPMRYVYKGKRRKGWINVINPFRGTMVLGSPGSGKSFSVYKPFISQMVARGFSVFCYDFKFPDLTEEIFNKYDAVKNDRKVYKHKPEFCIINFDNPRYSLRCNPIHPRYIQDDADTAEIADLIFRNVNGDGGGGGDKFFTDSAKMFVDCCVLYLRYYKNGKYCTFAHLIEMLNYNYQKTFKILQANPKVWAKLVPFRAALESKAMDQLMGQVASAQIPLNRFNAESLYWVMSGDDFSLDLNEPLHPKIICVGNNPDKQTIYGTALSLFTSRIFRLANRKHKLPSVLLLDELPTMQVRDLDSTIATARSNKVAVVWAAQDKSQIIKYYGEKDAKNIFNIVGNIFFGAVSGETAKDLADAFGTRVKEEKSKSESDNGESISTSWREKSILPRWKIETLSQGVFAGKVADNNDQKIKKKFFCAEIMIDMKELKKEQERWKKIPVQTDFGEKQIEDEVRANPRKYIFEYVWNRFFLKMLRQETRYINDIVEDFYQVETEEFPMIEVGQEENAESIAKEAAARFMEQLYSDNRKKDIEYLLGVTIEWQIEREIKAAVTQNFNDIRKDVQEMMDEEYSKVAEKEEEEKKRKELEAKQKAKEKAKETIRDEQKFNQPPYAQNSNNN